jgi:hypothetical protein
MSDDNSISDLKSAALEYLSVDHGVPNNRAGRDARVKFQRLVDEAIAGQIPDAPRLLTLELEEERAEVAALETALETSVAGETRATIEGVLAKAREAKANIVNPLGDEVDYPPLTSAQRREVAKLDAQIERLTKQLERMPEVEAPEGSLAARAGQWNILEAIGRKNQEWRDMAEMLMYSDANRGDMAALPLALGYQTTIDAEIKHLDSGRYGFRLDSDSVRVFDKWDGAEATFWIEGGNLMVEAWNRDAKTFEIKKVDSLREKPVVLELEDGTQLFFSNDDGASGILKEENGGSFDRIRRYNDVPDSEDGEFERLAESISKAKEAERSFSLEDVADH